MFRSSHFFVLGFWSLLATILQRIWKYYVIFVYILQGKLGKTERTGKKILQLKWPKYQKPKDKNIGWTKHKSKCFFLTFYMNSHLEMWPSTFNQLVTLQFNMHGFNLPYRDARALKCLYTQPHQRCVDNYRLRHLWCCIFNSFNQLHTYLFIQNCTKSFTHRFRNNTKTEVQYFYNIKNGSSIITSKSSS